MTIEEIKKGETEKLEFKREIPSKDSKLMKTVVAFSNSNGGLYGGLTLEEMLQGSSIIRNELVADTFLRMGIVEKWGTGIKRIADLCREHGLGEVEYSATDFCFTSTIRRTRKDLFAPVVPTVNDGKVTQEVTANGGINVPNVPKDGGINGGINLSENDWIVFKELEKNPRLTSSELVQITKMSSRTIDRCLKSLRDNQMIARDGSKKTGHWLILSTGAQK